MSADIFDLVARACAPRGVKLPPKPTEHQHVYHAILIRDDVSIGDLMTALRFSGIVVSTHPESGQTYIHRAPTPNNAA